MGEKYLLGVDVGTSSIKVAIIDEKGKLKGITSGVYNLIQEAPGWQQIDADDMWRACLECIGRLKLEQKIDLGKIGGIGISCLCPGLAAFDREGHVLVNPIIYSDQRSVEEAEEIKQKVGEEHMFDITANNVMAGAMSGTSMLWVKKHLPQIYEKIYCFGHINTLVAVRMTGNFAIDYSNASYTSLFETGGGYRWSDELCGKIGIPKEKLPPLMKSHEIVGGTDGGRSDRCGDSQGDPGRHRRRGYGLRLPCHRSDPFGRRMRIRGDDQCADRLRDGAEI